MLTVNDSMSCMLVLCVCVLLVSASTVSIVCKHKPGVAYVIGYMYVVHKGCRKRIRTRNEHRQFTCATACVCVVCSKLLFICSAICA